MTNETTRMLGQRCGGTTNRLQEQFGYDYDPAGNLRNRTNNALVQTFNVNSLNVKGSVLNIDTTRLWS